MACARRRPPPAHPLTRSQTRSLGIHDKATPFPTSAELDRDFWLSQLQLSLKGGSDHLDLGLQGPILFCTTCMGPGDQLLVSLAVNMSTAWPYRRYVKFCVLLLGNDDEETWGDLLENFRDFFRRLPQ